MPAPDEAAPSAADRQLRLYVWNLLLLLLFGLALSAYILYFTGWFPVVGGLLGLGGLFAWVAFVSGLLKNKRKEDLQDAFERTVLLRGRTGLVLLGVALLLGLGAARMGSLRLESLGDNRDRVVTVSPAEGNGASVRFRLSAHSEDVRLLPTGLFGSRSYRVKVEGLPHVVAPVRALVRETLNVPASFLARPVLLLRPTSALSAALDQDGDAFSLVLSVSDGPSATPLPRYRGRTVWIGADDDTELPESAVRRWKLELISSGASEQALTRWLDPLSIATSALLRAGDLVKIRVLHADGSEFTSTSVRVDAPTRSDDFFQEVKLDVPH